MIWWCFPSEMGLSKRKEFFFLDLIPFWERTWCAEYKQELTKTITVSENGEISIKFITHILIRACLSHHRNQWILKNMSINWESFDQCAWKLTTYVKRALFTRYTSKQLATYIVKQTIVKWKITRNDVIRAATSENVLPDMCYQRRFRSADAFAQADQNLHWAHFLIIQGCEVSSYGQRRLMRLYGCAGRICQKARFLTLRLISQ